jgi:hypothetical protein
MKKLFAIMCHTWNDNLSLTVEYLASFPENTVLIHIDSKVLAIEPFLGLVRNNVEILSTRVDIQWGGIQMVNATLSLMLAAEAFPYDYFFLLSGEDIPVSNNFKINEILKSAAGKDFIHIQDEINHYVDPAPRFAIKYPHLAYKKQKNLLEKIYLRLVTIFPKRNERGIRYLEKKNIKLYKGSQWFTLQNKTVKEILDFNRHHPEYLESFACSFCPDEMFFHSLIMSLCSENKYVDKTKVNDCLRFMDWNTGPEYPKLLSKTEILDLHDQGYFFARKVKTPLSKAEFMWLMV